MIVRHDPQRPILLTEEDVQEARVLSIAGGDQLILRSADGSETLLPGGLADLLLQAAVDIADHRGAQIEVIPDILRCSRAAALLGLQRLDLSRLYQEGEISAAYVHEDGEPYFRRDDIFAYREEKVHAQRRAFEALRALDDELGITD